MGIFISVSMYLEVWECARRMQDNSEGGGRCRRNYRKNKKKFFLMTKRKREKKNSLQIDQTSFDSLVTLGLSSFLLGTSSLQTLLPNRPNLHIYIFDDSINSREPLPVR